MIEEKWYDLSQDVIDKFNEIVETKAFNITLDVDFIGCSKQKALIVLKKIPDNFSYKMNKSLQVVINEELFDKFTDDDIIDILFEQQINRIQTNIDNGKISLSKPDLVTYSGIVSKYGIDKVCRANEVEELSYKQNAEDLL
tara:strand:+ start:113 stop:535 length:423 start_codon:yes stop_codon:yes gene_type:complete